MPNRQQRHQCIRDLLARNQVMSQHELLDLMAAESVSATQTTLSRDLRELGVIKGPDGYRLPDDFSQRGAEVRELKQGLRSFVETIEPAGSMVVLRTQGGYGRSIRDIVDQAGVRYAVGILADESTVFIAANTAGQARELSRYLQDLMGRRRK